MKLFDFNKTAPQLKSKGVLRFFGIVYHNFSDLVMLNLMFVLTAAPVFTVGASYKALIEVLGRYVKNEGSAPVRSFLKAFRSQFFKSTLYGFFFLLLFTIIAFAGAFYYNLAKQNAFFYYACTLSIAAIITLLMMVCYFFPLYTKIEQGFKARLVNSFVLVFVGLKESAMYLLTLCICALVVLALFPHSLPLVLAFPFSFTALASALAADEKITKIFIQNHRKDSSDDSGHFSP